MSNDKELRTRMRKIILKHIEEKVKAGEYKSFPSDYAPILPDMLGIYVDSVKNEIVENVVLCEGEKGNDIKYLRGQNNYLIPEVNTNWINNDWWQNNAFVTLEDAILAVAYDYLLREDSDIDREFTSQNEAACKIYECLAKVETNAENSKGSNDDFVKRAMALMSDLYDVVNVKYGKNTI